MKRREIAEQQIRFQERIQKVGVNLITCCNCETVLFHESGEEVIQCFCGEISPFDCEDMWYEGAQDSAVFDEDSDEAEVVKSSEEKSNYSAFSCLLSQAMEMVWDMYGVDAASIIEDIEKTRAAVERIVEEDKNIREVRRHLMDIMTATGLLDLLHHQDLADAVLKEMGDTSNISREMVGKAFRSWIDSKF